MLPRQPTHASNMIQAGNIELQRGAANDEPQDRSGVRLEETTTITYDVGVTTSARTLLPRQPTHASNTSAMIRAGPTSQLDFASSSEEL